MAVYRFEKKRKHTFKPFPEREPLVDFANPLDVTKRAKALLRENEREKARELLLEGLKNFPKNPYLLNMLMTCYGPSLIKEARGVYELAKERGVLNYHIYKNMLHLYSRRKSLKREDLEHARQVYEDAIKHCGPNKHLNTLMLRVYLAKGSAHIEEITEIYERAKKAGELEEEIAKEVEHLYWSLREKERLAKRV